MLERLIAIGWMVICDILILTAHNGKNEKEYSSHVPAMKCIG